MLVIDVGDVMCWRQLKDLGDGLGHVGKQHLLPWARHLLFA